MENIEGDPSLGAVMVRRTTVRTPRSEESQDYKKGGNREERHATFGEGFKTRAGPEYGVASDLGLEERRGCWSGV